MRRVSYLFFRCSLNSSKSGCVRALQTFILYTEIINYRYILQTRKSDRLRQLWDSADGGSCLTGYGRTSAFVVLREEAAGSFRVEERFDGLLLNRSLAPVLRTERWRTKTKPGSFYIRKEVKWR